ncbi:C-5 cytosine methyltransferase [Penicillium longicatenatum]|uniref:C-5 cytosine methyltransferase n=1 Tax=Penicillium longicatenatum TaxID=1561947 RepID=UPI002547CA18|nr:C-5 cytosine methyltransferase [Penicillium longicatenatum]KAJ5657749.1 C-5 cytosine methyltransferase [Penicillium longicatenatum]
MPGPARHAFDKNAPQPATAEGSSQHVTAACMANAQNGLPVAPEFVHGVTPARGRYIAWDLPPMSNLEEIFTDLAQNAMRLGLERVLQRLDGRPLRVATVCSGTESPLLALEMIQKGLGTNGERFQFEHLFSCEIVPFKQAYIERNFGPPLLFRDLRDLGGEKAQTAYGSLALIPGDPDILIAGTACVDFSLLNNNKEAQKEKGESAATFNALLEYCDKYRPRLVICENIKGAPWESFVAAWSGVGYTAAYTIVDSKKFYIPQTRERGYLIAVDDRRLEIPDSDHSTITSLAISLVSKFTRPCSSPTSSFLLGADDRRLEQIEKDLSTRLDATSARAEVPWEKYKIRHQECRDSISAGDQRPISRSKAGGVTCTGPDFYWHRWLKVQVERIWETLDIKFLVGLTNGHDYNYKERFIDVSQGADRGSDGTTRFGVTGCLTPCGLPFLTTRGGPLTGLEALSLQGLPIDRLILSHESSRELQDLAGNAMTTTTVGVVMLSALIAASSVLSEGAGSPLQVDAGPKSTPSPPLFTIEAGHSLVGINMEDYNPSDADARDFLSTIVARSLLAARLCSCEKQTRLVNDLLQCHLCGHTACSSCAGNPLHAYESKVIDEERIQPLEFDRMLRKTLPMQLKFAELGYEDFQPVRPQSLRQAAYDDTWEQYISSVQSALREEVRFIDITRTEVWTVFYEGESASMRLEIGGHGLQWLLFAKAPRSSPAQCVLREILAKPIARMRPAKSVRLFGGIWEVLDPISTEFALRVRGSGRQIPTYLVNCGLLGSEYLKSQVWTHLEIDCDQADVNHLDRDLRGKYQLLADCGTAEGCLYKKDCSNRQPSVYLFLDPRKAGPITQDAFVFSVEHRRNPGYEVRRTIAELPPTWRPVSVKMTQDKLFAYARRLHRVPSTVLGPYEGQPITYHHLDLKTDLVLRAGDCHDAVSLGLTGHRGSWSSTNPEKAPKAFQGICWALQRVGDALASHQVWGILEFAGLSTSCGTCKPTQPSLIWGRDQKERVVLYENPQEAAIYERAVKQRPPPFLIFENVDTFGRGELRLAVNLQSMAHFALGNLIDISDLNGPQFTWRLVPNARDMGRESHPPFALRDNVGDALHAQPPNFTQTLRIEQLRSLTWMIAQEADDARPFIEEEVEEAFLPMMAWRAEVKVSLPRLVHGGLVADEVGFGKTAVVLGLIDTQYERDKVRTRDLKTSPLQNGLLITNATLIVVPSNVGIQWKTEIVKFLGTKYRVITILSVAKLRALSFENIRQADIVLVSWRVLESPVYYSQLALFTGAASVPNQGKNGRAFDLWLSDAQDSLKDLNGLLATAGPNAFLKEVLDRHNAVKNDQDGSNYKPSRRLRGLRFQADANQRLQEVARRERCFAGDTEESKPQGMSCVEGAGEVPTEKQIRAAFDIPLGDEPNFSVKYPFLHAFQFNRLVIDEYTYANEDKQAAFLRFSARSRWILSGTPALRDFADVKSIARHLGVHLGIDDDADVPSHNARLKTKKSQLTRVEKFLTYQAPHSNDWYQNRNRHAQRFLDQFARQNFAVIDHIPFELHITLSEQFDKERANYESLFDRLDGEMDRAQKISNPDNDPAIDRLNDFVTSSQSPFEALLKASVTSRLHDHAYTISKCNSQITALGGKKTTQNFKLRSLIQQFHYLRSLQDPILSSWDQFMSRSSIRDCGDQESQTHNENLINKFHTAHDQWMRDQRSTPPLAKSQSQKDLEASCEERVTKATRKAETAMKYRKKSTAAPKPDEADDTDPISSEHESSADESRSIFRKRAKTRKQPKARKQPRVSGERTLAQIAADTMLEAKTGEFLVKSLGTDLNAAIKDCVKTSRDIRFHTAMKAIQSDGVPPCSSCEFIPPCINELTILRSCGHLLCKNCLPNTLAPGICVVQGCNASALPSKCIDGADLKSSTIITESSKFTRFINLIHSIPDNEQVLVFTQYDEIIGLLSRALEIEKVDFRTIRSQKVSGVEDFVNISGKLKKPPKALILPLGGAMAAGLLLCRNLQCANHIIFVTPLYTSTKHDYESGMEQAIGRARRYGQEKTVHVYHMLVKNTLEVNVVQERLGQILVCSGDHGKFVDSLNDEEMAGFEPCEGEELGADKR